MDASTIGAAYTGAKVALQTLRTVIATKSEIAADGRVIDALDQLGRIQDSLFELRNRLAELQEENHSLKEQIRAHQGWDARAAGYKLTQTPGGAYVYGSNGPPPHWACPACFEARAIHILQDNRVGSGSFTCPNCKVHFPVEPRQLPRS
jgi:hypothetical protein